MAKGRKRELMKTETEATIYRQMTQFIESIMVMMMMMMMIILSLAVTVADRVPLILIK